MAAITQLALLATSTLAAIKPSAYTAPGTFPTSVFTKYYNNPTATSAQPQPVISDPVSHVVYQLSLTDPDNLPLENTADPHPLPPPASASTLYGQALLQINSILASPTFDVNNCARCQSLLGVLKFVSLAAPEEGPKLIVAACEHFKLSSNCSVTHGPKAFGSVFTQVLANADVAGADGQAFCHNFFGGRCPLPPTAPLNLTEWFRKPKPNPLPQPKKPSGKRLKVLHLSDFHLDPRYATGSEANCTGSPCCRKNNHNSNSPNLTVLPAPRYGSFHCDTPLSLGLAALQAIPALTETQDSGFAWTIYTGDLVSHDPENQLSRDYVTYTETVVFDLFKRMLGSGPVYAALGNHDSYLSSQDAPHALGGTLGEQFSWNYDHVASLWEHEEWIPQTAVEMAKAHYGGFSVQRKDGLRIISINSDFWYPANAFNYINITNPDASGTLRFLTDELQDAEDKGDRVWVVGHVPTGWDGTSSMLNPSNLFYQIVDRFSPHVVANIFFGHTHEDQISIMYANNATTINAETAQALTWLGPSITPASNLNSGFRVYEVDSATFEVLDAHTWKSDVSTFPALDDQTTFGPAYTYEYSTREAYGAGIPNWTKDDPLNATWWHLVTEAMEADASLVATFNKFQGRESVKTRDCTGDCVSAKICYMRSGSASIALRNCEPGFGSVQS